MRTKLAALLLSAAVLLGVATVSEAVPASASTCAITNPYSPQYPNSGVQTVQGSNNGFASGCVLIIITHITGDPNHFWFTWYAQELVDPYYPDSAGCVKVQYRKAFVSWINTAYPQGYDCNSSDSSYTSGYMLIDASYGGSGYDPAFQTRLQLANGLVGTLTEYHVIQ